MLNENQYCENKSLVFRLKNLLGIRVKCDKVNKLLVLNSNANKTVAKLKELTTNLTRENEILKNDANLCSAERTRLENRVKEKDEFIDGQIAQLRKLEAIIVDLKKKLTDKRSTLSCNIIAKIRKEVKSGRTIKSVAAELGVSPSTVSRAIRGITHKECN
jgi:uncharacterized coiled-coil DUF342 family protein